MTETTPAEAPSGVAAWLRSPAARQLGVLLLVSLLLRVWTLAQMRAGNPLFAKPVLDDAVYVAAAQRFVDGAPAGSWFLAPLYPWLLGIAAKLTGAKTISLALASSVSLACGVATTGVLAVTARRLAGVKAAWITGLLHAAAGAFVFHDLIPGQEAVLSLLYAVAILLALHWHRTRSWWTVAAYGVVVGVAVLGRGTAALLLPAALPLVLGAAPECVPEAWRNRRRALLAAAVAVAGALVVLVPAATRNASVTGDLTPFTWSAGPNLYAANSPESREACSYHASDLGSSPEQMEHNARRIAERHRGRELRPSEVSAYWSERTSEELGIGVGLVPHVGSKLLLLFADHPIGTSHSIVAESRFARWLGFVPGSQWWMLALAVGGWWIVRPRERVADVVALAGLLTAIALLVLFPANRYRLAMLTTSLVLIGPGAVWFMGSDARRRGVAVALALAVAVTAHLPHWTDAHPVMHAANRANVGRMLFERGRVREAAEVLREADRDEPDSIAILAAMAAVLGADGDYEGAQRAAQRHNEIMDTRPAGRVRKVLDLAERGRRDPAALAEAERLGQEIAPTLLNDDLRAYLWANMALVAALRGDADEAAARMKRAREHDPDLLHIEDVQSRMP